MMHEPEDFEKWVAQAELEDKAEAVGYLTPRELAKLVGIAPQQVYYWLRKGVLESETCKCGRRILEVKTSLETIKARRRTEMQKLSEVDSVEGPE